MLLPGIIFFIVYRYGPIYGSIIAFKDYYINHGIINSPWADPWYKHFLKFYESPYFSQVIGNTILISVYKLVWGMPPGIILALILNEVRNGPLKRWVQTISYMPHFLSWVIVYGIMLAFFSESSGLVNNWLNQWFGAKIPFMTSPDIFRSMLVGSEIWKDLGWSAIIYLAAIAGIDPTLYEAARVDGASRLKIIWHVTLPGISNVIIFLLIIRLGHMLDAGFDQIYILYNVQVYPVADIIDTWVFRTGLEQFNFSLGAAVGLFKSVIGMAMVITANQVAKRWGQSIW